jgi:hypothetical protein
MRQKNQLSAESAAQAAKHYSRKEDLMAQSWSQVFVHFIFSTNMT